MYVSSSEKVTFNPGPSYLAPEVRMAMCDIISSGFLSESHRGEAFSQMSLEAIQGLRQKMNIPSNYHIFYQPSATVAMDTLLRNLVSKKSFHFVHGAFSNLFRTIAKDIGLDPYTHESAPNQKILWQEAKIPSDVELICVTHNETSTGLMWPKDELYQLRVCYPEPLLAVDVTSSFGALSMRWEMADVWFGSVQKCLGLPSGMGYLLVSPRAYEHFLNMKKTKTVAPWQRFDVLCEKMHTYQTPDTPNMLAIAMLAYQMQNWNLEVIERALNEKAKFLYEAPLNWTPYIQDRLWRSLTVANFIVNDPKSWHQQANLSNFVLGEGYGALKVSCVRIANFPSITQDHLQRLVGALSANFKNR